MTKNTIVGHNVLTVLLAKASDNNHLNMFFCPYTKNITTQYQGSVETILPGFNPDADPQIMVKPQRMEYNMNIYYSFKETDKKYEATNFWIQDQYFRDAEVKQYFCYNCQAPSIYFTSDRAVHFNTKADVEKDKVFECANKNCRKKFRYLGIVAIQKVL